MDFEIRAIPHIACVIGDSFIVQMCWKIYFFKYFYRQTFKDLSKEIKSQCFVNLVRYFSYFTKYF